MIRTAVLAFVLTAVVACVTFPTYVPPVGLTSENAAAVIGTRTDSGNALLGDFRTYFARIDDVATGVNPMTDTEIPILIEPGEHTVIAAFLRPGGFGVGYQGSATFRLTLEAGKTYYLRGQLLDRGKSVATWVEEGGQAVAHSSDASVGRVQPQIMMPLPVK